MIMPIDFDDGEAECGRLVIKWFKIIGLTYGRPLLQPVAVHDHSEPIKLVMRRGHHGLPVAALLQFAIADEHVGTSPGNVQLG